MCPGATALVAGLEDTVGHVGFAVNGIVDADKIGSTGHKVATDGKEMSPSA
jgi:hypothetical protein